MTIFLMLDTHRVEVVKNFEIFCYYFYEREDLKNRHKPVSGFETCQD